MLNSYCRSQQLKIYGCGFNSTKWKKARWSLQDTCTIYTTDQIDINHIFDIPNIKICLSDPGLCFCSIEFWNLKCPAYFKMNQKWELSMCLPISSSWTARESNTIIIKIRRCKSESKSSYYNNFELIKCPCFYIS